MPITIDYSPVGALGAAAAMAGRAAGQREQFAQGIQLADLDLRRQQAQDKAFALQTAIAQRKTAEGTRTPAADHIAEHLALTQQARQDDQKRTMDQLDSLLQAGHITEKQHQQAKMGVLSGSKELIDRAIIPLGTADPMELPGFRASLQMTRDKRTSLQEERKELFKAMQDPLNRAKIPVIQAQIDAIDKEKLPANYQEEQDMIMRATKKLAQPAAPEEAPTPSAQPGFPDPSQFEEGHLLRHKTTGALYKLQRGIWTPFTPPAPAAPSPASPAPASVAGPTPNDLSFLLQHPASNFPVKPQ